TFPHQIDLTGIHGNGLLCGVAQAGVLVGITLGQFVGDNGSSGSDFVGGKAGIGQKALNLGGIALKSAVQCGQIVVAGSKPDGPHPISAGTSRSASPFTDTTRSYSLMRTALVPSSQPAVVRPMQISKPR